MMKKNIYTLLILLFGAVSYLQAQVDPLFFQQTQHRSLINPAATARGGNIDAALLVRQQWVGFSDMATNAVYVSGFLNELQSGIGLRFVMDKYGPTDTKNIKFNYAFFAALNDDAVLSLGIGFGVMSNVYKGSDTYFFPQHGNDPVVPMETISKAIPAFDFGAEFITRHFELGASITHISYGRLDQMLVRPMRNYYSYSRVKVPINRHWDFIPGVTWHYNRMQSTYEANLGVRHNNNFTFNAIYRNPMNIGFSTGLTLIEGFRLAYSYDYGINTLSSYNGGSHEIVISYHIPVHISFIGTKIRFFKWKTF